MRVRFLFLFACISGILFIGAVKENTSNGFIKVKGMRFEIDGKRYCFAGTNMWYGCYLGEKNLVGGRERLIRELDHLKSLGINNIRLLGASEQSDMKNSLPSAIQKSPGVYDENLLEGLDFVLDEMAKRNMYAVIYLNNYWQWTGGMSQYVSWQKNQKMADPYLDNNWHASMNHAASFYSNNLAQYPYRQYISKLINRKNKINGKIYRNDPTIMSWQLANEPRPGADGPQGEQNMADFIKWIDETAGYIRSIDKNHLISSGSEGTVGCLHSESNFLTLHNSPNIDYLTVHIWLRNWGWLDPKKTNDTYPEAEKKALNYLQKHIKMARQLEKPLVMEEFGIDRDHGALEPGTPATARDRYFKAMFGFIYKAAQIGSPVCGTNFWAWSGEGRIAPRKDMVFSAMNYTGDPFPEPQGTNSVFDVDKKTLAIIAEHARQMKTLNK